jgi:hypothetical protein
MSTPSGGGSFARPSDVGLIPASSATSLRYILRTDTGYIPGWQHPHADHLEVSVDLPQQRD